METEPNQGLSTPFTKEIQHQPLESNSWNLQTQTQDIPKGATIRDNQTQKENINHIQQFEVLDKSIQEDTIMGSPNQEEEIEGYQNPITEVQNPNTPVTQINSSNLNQTPVDIPLLENHQLQGEGKPLVSPLACLLGYPYCQEFSILRNPNNTPKNPRNKSVLISKFEKIPPFEFK